MDYTLAGLRNRMLVDKLDDDEFDTTVIDNFFNDTLRDIYNQFELSFQEKIFEGTIPAGTTIFKFPTDVVEIQSLVITSPDGEQKDLHNYYLPFRDFNRKYPTPGNNLEGMVYQWTLYAGRMLLDKPTDQDYVMTIYYIKTPTLLELDSDVPDLPPEFAELLLLGCLERIQIRNEDYDLASQTESQYQQQLVRLINKYGFRKLDGPVKMGNSQV